MRSTRPARCAANSPSCACPTALLRRAASTWVGPGAAHDMDWDILTRARTARRLGFPAGPDNAITACSCSPARRRARCWRSWRTPTSPTRASPWLTGPGYPGRLLPERPGRSGVNLRRLTRLGAAPPDRIPEPPLRRADGRRRRIRYRPRSACGQWILCGWKRATGCSAPTLKRPRNSVLEAGLGPLRAFSEKNADFTGRAALLKQKEQGVPNIYCTIEVDADDADPFGNEPVYIDGRGGRPRHRRRATATMSARACCSAMCAAMRRRSAATAKSRVPRPAPPGPDYRREPPTTRKNAALRS